MADRFGDFLIKKGIIGPEQLQEAETVAKSRRLKLQTLRTITPIKLGRLLEQQPDWVWTAIEPLNAGMPLPDIAPAKDAPSAASAKKPAGVATEASVSQLFRRKT